MAKSAGIISQSNSHLRSLVQAGLDPVAYDVDSKAQRIDQVPTMDRAFIHTACTTSLILRLPTWKQ